MADPVKAIIQNSCVSVREQKSDTEDSKVGESILPILRKWRENLKDHQISELEFCCGLFYGRRQRDERRHLYLFQPPEADSDEDLLRKYFPHYSSRREVDGEQKMMPGMILHECGCDHFSRVGTIFDPRDNPRRCNLEAQVVENLQKIQPNKVETISILSLGAGGMLQEFRVLNALVLDGYFNIHLVCVDHIFESQEEMMCVDGVKQLFSKFPGIRIEAFQSISEIPSNLNFHQIMAIDYPCFDGPDTLVDLVKAQTHLKPIGQAVVAFSNEDLILSSDFHLSSLGPKSLVVSQIQSVKEALPREKKSWSIFFDYDDPIRFSNVLFAFIGALRKLKEHQLPNKVEFGFSSPSMEKRFTRMNMIQNVFGILYPDIALQAPCKMPGYDMVFATKDREDQSRKIVAVSGGSLCLMELENGQMKVETIENSLSDCALD